jgi:hypothetical protein
MSEQTKRAPKISMLGVKDIGEGDEFGLGADVDPGADELGGSNSAKISTHPEDPDVGLV